jgi:hypothetical protein
MMQKNKIKISKNWCTIILLMVISLLSFSKSYATHIAGGDLTYRSLGNNQYLITLVIYRDCEGIPARTSASILCSSTSGASFTASAFPLPGTGQEITFPCFSSLTTCSGGTNPGYQRYEYQTTISLPTDGIWTISYSDCARNCDITTAIGSCLGFSDFCLYIEAKINTLLAPNDNSPSFSNYPVAFLCLGQNFTYNHGVVDLEGDSLVYSFINPMNTANSLITFAPGYSPENFLTSSSPILLNTRTGDINLTPSNISEVGITAIKVDCYRNKVFIGSVMRDIEFRIQDCTPNVLPTATGINGSNSFDTLVCAGTPLCFDIYTNDANVGQNLTVTWNEGVPGGSFTTSSDPFPTATFCWTPTQAEAREQPYSFTITVKDDNCAYNAYQVYSYRVFVPYVPLDSAFIQPHCDTAERGSIYMKQNFVGMPFNWLWNDGSTAPTRTGLKPGQYDVTVTNAINCVANKSFVIQPVPSKLKVDCELLQKTSTSQSADGALKANPSGGTVPYTYLWSNGSTSAINSGLTKGGYNITVTDTFGCIANNTCQVTTVCPSISCSGTTVSCPGYNNASATVKITGDTTGTNVKIQWNHNPLLNKATLFNLAPGSYTAVVTNNNGCIDSCTITIPTSGCNGFRDYSQGGYGATPKGNNVATYLKSKFTAAFPSGLTIGCTNKLRLTSWQAVVDFLPANSTARALPAGTLTNPGTSYSNVLAGQLVTAVLNVTFDAYDANFSPSSILLKDLVIATGPFMGWTFNQLIAEANKALGGCGSLYSYAALNNALDKANTNYDYNDFTNSQLTNKCYLSCPVTGGIGTLKIFSNVTYSPERFDWMIYPNPANTSVALKFVSNVKGNVHAELLNTMGQKSMNLFDIDANIGQSIEKEFSTEKIKPGIYMVRIVSGKESFTKKLVVVH